MRTDGFGVTCVAALCALTAGCPDYLAATFEPLLPADPGAAGAGPSNPDEPDAITPGGPDPGSGGAAGTSGGGGGEGGSAGASGNAGSGGVAGAGGTPLACPPPPEGEPVPDDLTALGAEFDQPRSVYSFDDNGYFLTLEVQNGVLVLVPRRDRDHNGWYEENGGPLFSQGLSGDFVVEVSVEATLDSDASAEPLGPLAGAGLVVLDRNPFSWNSWLAYDVGAQPDFIGRAVKDTQASQSAVYLSAPGSRAAQLRICRVGETFYFFHRTGNEDWSEERFDASVSPNVEGEAGFADGQPLRFVRPDLTSALVVGLTVGFYEGSRDIRGSFDYVRVGRVSDACDCTRPLAPAPACTVGFCRSSAQRYLRVTQDVRPGNFAQDASGTALELADRFCADDANAQQNPELRGRSWIAYLAADGIGPELRLLSDMEWVRPDGVIIFDDTDSVHDESGEHAVEIGDRGLAWTGLTRTGNENLTCENWTNGAALGSVGTPDADPTSSDWRFTEDASCSSSYALYCFEAP